MAGLIRPVSFGSNFSFGNSYTLRSVGFDVGAITADVKLMRQADGSIYNANGTPGRHKATEGRRARYFNQHYAGPGGHRLRGSGG